MTCWARQAKYSSRSSDIDLDSRAANCEAEIGYIWCTGGGELVLVGNVRVTTYSPPPAEVLAASASSLFIPDPYPGDGASWAGTNCAAECAGEAVGVGGLADSFSPAGSSTAALGGEGTTVAVGSLAGELVVSSMIVVALHEFTGLVLIIRSKREQKVKGRNHLPGIDLEIVGCARAKG